MNFVEKFKHEDFAVEVNSLRELLLLNALINKKPLENIPVGDICLWMDNQFIVQDEYSIAIDVVTFSELNLTEEISNLFETTSKKDLFLMGLISIDVDSEEKLETINMELKSPNSSFTTSFLDMIENNTPVYYFGGKLHLDLLFKNEVVKYEEIIKEF